MEVDLEKCSLELSQTHLLKLFSSATRNIAFVFQCVESVEKELLSILINMYLTKRFIQLNQIVFSKIQDQIQS